MALTIRDDPPLRGWGNPFRDVALGNSNSLAGSNEDGEDTHLTK